ncbi:MAG: hypothetical protein LBV67_01675 [Streptococcaceae bacterium]|jgi:flagellar biosynthesis protein FlhB|nr:hypothetical protein [Streptococcaceae bacterium]
MQILFIILALVIFAASYFILKKTEAFLPLVAEELKDLVRTFFKIFGFVFLGLGIGALVVAFFDERIYYLALLLFLLTFSALFSFMYARFIGTRK